MRKIALLLSLVCMIACVGCSVGSGGKKGSADTLTWAITSDITALDPAFTYDGPTMNVMLQVSEGLLALTPEAELVPCLAESWEAKDDVTYVYTIRQDVTFSDGSPMTMEDVLYSLERYRDPEVASYLSWMYGNVASIEQTGDWELTVTLYEADATWQYVFATAAGHVIKKDDCEEKGDTFGTPSGGVIATGPYKVDHWTVGSEILLTYNENYWDPAYSDPDVKAIQYNIISEDTTRAAALKSGQADIDLMIPGTLYEDVASSDQLHMEIQSSNNTLFLAMNCDRIPVEVRRAIACAIDKESIGKNIVKEAGTMANMMPNGSSLFTMEKESWESYYESAPDYDYDVEQAAAYMAQSEYAQGMELTLLVDETNLYNQIALTIQQSLAEIGITVSIEKITQDELIALEFGDQVDENGQRPYDMALFEWEADWPDPSGNIMGIFNSAYLGEGGTNFPGYANEEVDALLNAQAVSMDPAQRTELLQQALTIIIDEAPVVPILYSNYLSAYNNKIESFDFITWSNFVKDMKLAK